MAELDPAKLKAGQDFLGQLAALGWTAGMASVGLRLGLFDAMSSAGALTAAELAHRTGLSERWVLEWLRQQTAGGVLEYAGGDRFSLSPEMASLLCDADSPTWGAPRIYGFRARFSNLNLVEESMRTGVGFPWEAQGFDGAVEVTERSRRNWYRQELVQSALPQMDGVIERLTAGTSVVDLGCGSGLAIIELAKAFPKSVFVGYEASDEVLQRAEANVSEAGVRNVRFADVRVAPPQPDHTADLVLSFDALHDMAHPDVVARLVHGLLKPDGVWFVLEIPCEATFEENLAKSRTNVTVTYATSLVACLPSSLSEPGGAGLGTLGLPEPVMRDLALAAGFTRFRRLPKPSPHALFEVRP